jgi:hypothetical protein
MDYSYDIVLENEDYTIGKVIEYMLYEKYYQGEKIFTYCGFKKFHPHNTESVIRIAYGQPSDTGMVSQHIRIACVEANEVFSKISTYFS